MDDDKANSALEQAKEHYAPLINMFSNPVGMDALKILKEEFISNTSYCRGDSHHTAYLNGQADVVRWLDDVVNKNGAVK